MPRRDGFFRSEVVRAPQNKVVYASARRYSPGQASRRVSKAGKWQGTRDWQTLLWNMYDQVPEFRFAVDWVGNLLSKATLQVRENGKETTNPEALNALASLFGGADGHAEMFRLLGIHFTLAGEAWIIGEERSTDEDDWRIVAASEVVRMGNSIKVEDEEVSESALCLRLWKPHPRQTSLPNSPARAVIPILNELVKLTQHVDATASSRLASAGILLVPSEMELPSVTVTRGSNPGEEEMSEQRLEGADGLSEMLIEIASTAIQDRSDPSALVPLVVTMPGEYIEKVSHIKFSTEFDDHVKGLREEAIRRMASGMDMPPEVVLGTADMNHWGSFAMEEAAVKAHTEPLLVVILSSLTTGYLRPYLEESGVENPEDFTFEADTKEMRLRPNRSREAMELYDRGELSPIALLRENGFDDIDAISEKELASWLTKQVARGQTMPAQVAAALRTLGVDVPEVTEEETEVVHEARPTPSLREHPRRDAPDPDESEAEGAKAERNRVPREEMSLAILTAAADQMVYRALERAGNRVKGKLNGLKVNVPAAELYLIADVAPTAEEADFLLEDAWTCVDRYSQEGIDCVSLRAALHSYTRDAIMEKRPHSATSLRESLKGLVK